MLKYVSAALSCGHCYSHKSLPFNFNWAFLCHCLFVDQVMRPSKGSKIPLLTSDFWLILRFISHHVFHVCLWVLMVLLFSSLLPLEKFKAENQKNTSVVAKKCVLCRLFIDNPCSDTYSSFYSQVYIVILFWIMPTSSWNTKKKTSTRLTKEKPMQSPIIPPMFAMKVVTDVT